MKNTWLLIAGISILAGCAGMPNVPINLPIPGLPSGTGITASQVTQGVSALQTATKEYSEAEEIELGEGVAQSMLGAAPLLPNANLQRYVNQVGRWLSLHTSRPDLPWRFGVLDNENINAFAIPGGSIFITNGLLKKLNSESELAGVLGHEIAHVIQKHQINALKAGAFGELGKMGLQGYFDNQLGKTGVGQVARAAGAGELGADLLKQGFLVKPLDRGLEYEADRMGVVIAARSGYDPYGYIGVLQTLEAQAQDDPFLALIFKTHPAPADRIAELEKLIDTLDRYQGQEQGRERFAAAMGRAQAPTAAPARPTQQRQAPPPKPRTSK